MMQQRITSRPEFDLTACGNGVSSLMTEVENHADDHGQQRAPAKPNRIQRTVLVLLLI